ncbi:MAG TPA: cytidine deaminase [Rhizomicrobium sp.]|nr:cytidine deaminase [Rhizomicrobium sp.]
MSITRRDTVILGLAGGALLASAAEANAAKPVTGGNVTPTPEQQKLIDAAVEVRQRAYAPYSHFLVGAALETEDGTVFKGCNVENLSYGATICAERNAVFQAVAAGHRKFKAIAVVGDLPAPITPCGMCRQVLGEFGGQTEVICTNLKKDVMVSTVGALLPAAFDFDPSKY